MSEKINLTELSKIVIGFNNKDWSNETDVILTKLSTLKDNEFKVDTCIVQGNVFSKTLIKRLSLLNLSNVTYGGFELSSLKLKRLELELKLHHISIDSSNAGSFISYILSSDEELLALFYVFR